MKKLFIVLSFVLLFAGCQQPTNMTTTVKESADFYVKNSAWNNVDLTTIPQYSRSVGGISDLAEAQKIVAEYNAETNNDQLVILTEDIPIENAPDVTVYYVKAVGQYYDIGEQYTVTRVYYAQYCQMYAQDAASRGYIIFVDKIHETVPVIVIPPDTRTRHEKYAIYMINKYDKIVVYQGFKYEMHIDELWDSLDSETQEGYKNNIDNLMAWYVMAYNSDAVCTTYEDAPWRVVSGQLYTEPPAATE